MGGQSRYYARAGTVAKRSLLALTLAFCLAGCSGTQSPAPASPPSETSAPANSAPIAGIGAETVITVHGKIVAVDSATRQVTLQGPSGKDVTLSVNNPYNLNSIKVGDRYMAQFSESVTIVGRGPSDQPPVASLAAGLWSAGPGETPFAAAAQQAHLVLVIAAVDQADQRVTLKAPDGSTENIHVTNPDSMQGVRVGDQIVVTLTQSVAIALVPEAGSA